MKYYDLHIFSNHSTGENSIIELALAAESLDYSGICVCDAFHSMEKLKQIRKEISNAQSKTSCEIIQGVYIQAKTRQELQKDISKLRDSVLLLIVAGGEYEVNRAACESSKVDILAHPERERPDSGLDEACLRAAAKNDVAIQINFREILYSYRKPRSYTLFHIKQNIMLCEELKAKMVICSGAQSIWDLRTPRELAAIANVLGMDLGKAVSSVSDMPQNLIEKNRKKFEGLILGKGVEIVE